MTASPHDHDAEPDAGGAGDAAPSRPTAPVGVPRPAPADLVAAACADWRTALVARAGHSALADVDRLGEAQLDLSAAHPSGIAQLFAGRATRLSNLVREGSALASAKRRARAVGALAEDHAQRYGLASAFLAIGVATWTEVGREDDVDLDDVGALALAAGRPVPGRPGSTAPGPAAEGAPDGDAQPAEPAGPRTVRAPVLLRPVTVQARGRGESDYDLALQPSIEVNPVLAGALRSHGALLDPMALARTTFAASGFDPRPALDRLRALGAAVLPDFRLEDRLLVGTFAHPEQTLVEDLDALAARPAEHEVVAALAGEESALRALSHPLPPPVLGDRPLDAERGVGDLDPAQAAVLDALAAGHHLLVDAPAGSDVAGLVAAVVADAAAAGRTVLYVAGHRRAATGLTERLTVLGLEDLVLDVAPEADWRAQAGRRLLGAMTVEPMSVDPERVHVVQRELLDRRGRLHAYIEGMHASREPWGASAYDALQALARLIAQRPSPTTRVRLTPAVAESLTGERRAQATADLVRAACLGAFSAAATSSAWYGADLLTQDRARAALARVNRLLDVSLPGLQQQAEAVAEETGLTRAATPAQWAEQLAMLAGVRAALDTFRPLVFERSAADLVAATASRSWRSERGIQMGHMLRRRLRKQARDMVRPGRPVEDLHAALVDVQAQRELWQAHCPAGGWPRIPPGLAGIEAVYREAEVDLQALGDVLAGTPAGGELAHLQWRELAERLRRLQQDSGALADLPERTALVRGLSRQGLGDLLSDLAERQVAPEAVTGELELAWWSTVFEEILRHDPALAGYDGAALSRLVAEFRALDRRHVADRAVVVAAGARETLRAWLAAADADAQELFAEIVEDRFSGLRPAVERYPGLARHLRPCLVGSPMLVPQLLPPARTEDLVVLDAAGHLPVDVVVGSIARGRQLLVVADTRAASGSAVPALAAVLPVVPLTADASRRDPLLTAFLSEHGYAGRLTATPLPVTAELLRLETVDGTGMPSPSGAVEGTRAEVDRVVELVIDHALTRPEESLAVVTASAVHADRVREAVMAEVRDNPGLASFFAPGQAEPFVVVEVGATQGLSREAVIFSVGYGRTPHGRVLHRFGALSEPGGEALLLGALGALRHRLTVVSCFTTQDLDPERLRAPGAQLLADLLELIAGQGSVLERADVRPPEHHPTSDRLVLDLAERLWRKGLPVELNHGAVTGGRIPLVVGHPDVPGELLVAVLTDDDAYVAEPSVRVRDRQIPERLERLGWTVVQVWSAAAFLDPDGETDAIVAATTEAARRRMAALPGDGLRTVPSAPVSRDHGIAPPGRPSDAPASDGTAAVAAGASVGPADGADVDQAERAGGAARSDGVGLAASEEAAGRRPTSGAVAARWREDDVPAPARSAPVARPALEAGQPIGALSDEVLDELVTWVRAERPGLDDAEMVAALRAELGLSRRAVRADARLKAAVRRAR